MQKMQFSPYSESLWTISPPAMAKFISDFNMFNAYNDSYIDIMATFDLERDNPVGEEDCQYVSSVRLNCSVFQSMIDMLETSDDDDNSTDSVTSTNAVFVLDLFPK